jgi:polysaccharide export outer membrane protein
MIKSKIKYLFVFVVALVALSSCITNKDMNYLQDIESTYPKYEPKEYIIKPGDEIAMQVFSTNPDIMRIFSQTSGSVIQVSSQFLTYKVYADGTIDLPFIAKIDVAGKTIREAQSQIEFLFRDHINSDFAINMVVANRYFYVIGKSKTKGQYSFYKDKMNIFEAIALAGDLDVVADRKKVKIIRTTGDQQTVVKFDLRSKNIIDSEYYYIQPDDVIFVGETTNSFFKITSYTTFLTTITSTLSFILLVVAQ